MLSFKILANMPLCFVSIFENLRGPNAVYTPWEGQGAQAIAAGIDAIRDGLSPCVVVGGCDVKTHVLGLLSLEQLGHFDSWSRHGAGAVPGEGAVFLVLESHASAHKRGARVYAVIDDYAMGSIVPQRSSARTLASMLQRLDLSRCTQIVSGEDGDRDFDEVQHTAVKTVGLGDCPSLRPKTRLGNLFAAAAGVQIAIAAMLAAEQPGEAVLANCLGPGTEQAAFLVEAP